MLIDVMHAITSTLQTPVIIVLMVLAAFVIVLLGMLIAEFFTERRYFKLSIPHLIDELQKTNDPAGVVRQSPMLRRQQRALLELLNHPEATPLERESMAVNIVAQERAIFDNRVKITDFISKVAPMLGLMGTLIPLGPGIIAIGEGDTATLSESLLVAFDTTIMGLIVAALALLVSAIRKSWYAKYNAAFEAACEIVLEKANETGTAHTRADADVHTSRQSDIRVDTYVDERTIARESENSSSITLGDGISWALEKPVDYSTAATKERFDA